MNGYVAEMSMNFIVQGQSLPVPLRYLYSDNLKGLVEQVNVYYERTKGLSRLDEMFNYYAGHLEEGQAYSYIIFMSIARCGLDVDFADPIAYDLMEKFGKPLTEEYVAFLNAYLAHRLDVEVN